MMKGLWMLVSGDEAAPAKSQAAELLDWKLRAQKAAGVLFLAVEHEQRIHLGGIEDSPVQIWQELEEVHLAKHPRARFNAYDELFTIRKCPEESLQALMNRVEESMRTIKNLRPKDFTLDKLDQELACMALLRSLPEDYNHLTSSLLLLDSLDKQKVHSAFITEEINRSRRSDALSTPNSTDALKTSSSTSVQSSGQFRRPKNNYKCDYCGRDGHSSKRCHKRMDQLIKDSESSPSTANTAAASASSSSTIPEFAGSASLRSDPSSLDPTSSHADSLWCADTGATAHMTPHRHWLHNYQPHRIPICLADNTIVYSSGVGSVLFVPELEGQKERSVEFSNVLHVPKLRNNLLSVLYLTRYKQFSVVILESVMTFIRSGSPLFAAAVNALNSAYLEGTTVPIASIQVNAALSSSTLPMDTSLWHRRLCHHHYKGIDRILKEDLVSGLVIQSKASPDPICEPCLAGKMHANPFPSSLSRTSRPLELIHSDLHGPLPVHTHSGFRYWVSFIDDYTRFRAVFPLRAKSDTFEAFKAFKSYAENHHGAKIKTLRDDKGGEYMSNAFLQFTTDAGIARQHTVRNRPQQNGVAE